MQTLGLVVHSQVQSIMWIVDALGQERVKQLQPPRACCPDPPHDLWMTALKAAKLRKEKFPSTAFKGPHVTPQGQLTSGQFLVHTPASCRAGLSGEACVFAEI